MFCFSDMVVILCLLISDDHIEKNVKYSFVDIVSGFLLEFAPGFTMISQITELEFTCLKKFVRTQCCLSLHAFMQWKPVMLH